MNNAKLTENILEEEQEVDKTPFLLERQKELIAIIEAVDSVNQSNYYKFLEGKVFQTSLSLLVNQLCNEKDNQKRDWLQGAIAILSKYSDFKKFSEAYRLELQQVRKQLKNKGR